MGAGDMPGGGTDAGRASLSAAGRAFVEDVLIEYAPALTRLFTSRLGRDADDAFQQFTASILMERMYERLRDLPAGEPREGLLLRAAKDFCVDLNRREIRRLRAHQNHAANSTPSIPHVSNRWAERVFAEALERTRAHFEERKTGHWQAFEACIVGPLTSGNAPPEPEETAASLGFDSAEQMRLAVRWVRDRVRHTVDEILLERARNDSDFDELRAFFLDSI